MTDPIDISFTPRLILNDLIDIECIKGGILKIDTPEKLKLWKTLSPEEQNIVIAKYQVLHYGEAYQNDKILKTHPLHEAYQNSTHLFSPGFEKEMMAHKEEQALPSIKDTYLKDKAKKPKVTLLCPHFLEELTKLMTHYYPEKFVNNDYRKQKRDRDLYLDAIHRHLLCIIKGEEVDPEDNTPHIVKIASNCMMYYNNHLIATN